jgi:hypothetical protein
LPIWCNVGYFGTIPHVLSVGPKPGSEKWIVCRRVWRIAGIYLFMYKQVGLYPAWSFHCVFRKSCVHSHLTFSSYLIFPFVGLHPPATRAVVASAFETFLVTKVYSFCHVHRCEVFRS